MSKNNQPQPLYAGNKYRAEEEYKNANIHALLSQGVPSIDNLYLINDGYLAQLFSRVEGKILTTIEAGTDDREKREAMKSIARQMIWSVASEIRLLELIKE